MATTLGTTRVKTLLLQSGLYGLSKASLVLEVGAAPAVGALLTLTVGTLPLVMRVVRADLAAPDKPQVVLMSGAGWDALVATPFSWQEDAGVRLQTVLSDLAAATGEPIELPGDSVIGEHYEVIASREGDPVRYSDVLHELADEGLCGRWRVDPDGVTRFGPRPGVEVTSRATVLGRDGGPGYARLGIDDPAPFFPGNTVSGAPIVRLVVTEDSGELTAETWTTSPAAAPSVRDSVRKMVERHLQEYVRTYLVARARDDGRLDLVPPEDAAHLPELAAVKVWTLGGATVKPVVGSEVLVVFRDRKRTRPVAISFAPGTPEEVEIDADDEIRMGNPATLGAARLTDTVAVPLLPATFVGLIEFPSGTFNPAKGMVIWPGQTMGNISTASTKVKIQ